jgi:hypothetical protein
MKTPNMLYRSPGPLVFEGVSCETTVVDEDDVEAALAEGWNRTWYGAEQDVKDRAAELAANEAEQARIAAELAAVGQGDGTDQAAGKKKSK